MPIDKCGYGTTNNGTTALYGPIDPGSGGAGQGGWVKVSDPGAGSYRKGTRPSSNGPDATVANALARAHNAAIAYYRQQVQLAEQRQQAREKALAESEPSNKTSGEYPSPPPRTTQTAPTY
jgi:hypothetical protein